MTFGVITDITQPQRGQRGYVYTVKWDDGSQSEEFERNLWKNTSIGTDRDDDDEDDDSDDSIPDMAPDDDSDSSDDDEEPEVVAENEIAAVFNNVIDAAVHENINVAVHDNNDGGGRGRRGRGGRIRGGGGRGRGRGNVGAVLPAEAADPPDPLCPNGQRWEVEHNINSNIESPTIQKSTAHFRVKLPNDVRILATDGIFHNLMVFFIAAFPWFYLDTIVTETNLEFEKNSRDGKPVTKGTIIKFLGLLLAMALNPIRGSRGDYWATEKESGTMLGSAHNFGQYGMSKNRFEMIAKNLRLSNFVPNVVGQDPWIPIRPFINAFNQNIINTVTPGNIIVVDECMSSWLGRDLKWSASGMPHITKIIRKPQGIGAELKAAADGESGAILRIEVQEGAAAMANAKYMKKPDTGQPWYAQHTAITLRLVEPWFGTGRTIIGDSAFASLRTCVALLEYGLFFIGIVKTASKMFPKGWFSQWEKSKPARGSHMYLKTAVEIGNVLHAIMAVGWKCKMVKTFISSVGNCLPASDQEVHRTKIIEEDGHYVTQEYIKTTSRVNIVAHMFKYFSVIDIHDHLRQGILKMEESWKTRTWWHRLFATVLGIIYTNSYNYYRNEYNIINHGSTLGMLSYEDYLGILSFQMINNDFDTQDDRRNRIRSRSTFAVDDSVEEILHIAKPLETHEVWNQRKIDAETRGKTKNWRANATCTICGYSKAAYHCVDCSTPQKWFTICNPTGSSPQCWIDHEHANEVAAINRRRTT